MLENELDWGSEMQKCEICEGLLEARQVCDTHPGVMSSCTLCVWCCDTRAILTVCSCTCSFKLLPWQVLVFAAVTFLK